MITYTVVFCSCLNKYSYEILNENTQQYVHINPIFRVLSIASIYFSNSFALIMIKDHNHKRSFFMS